MRGKPNAGYGLTGTCLATALLLAGGCGAGTGAGNDGGTSGTPTSISRTPDAGSAEPTTSTTPSAPAPTQSAPTQLPTKPTKPTVAPERGRTTLKGQLTEAVEAGCVVLSTDDGTYVLLGAPAKVGELDPGTELVVRGRVANSTMTTCQQGTPFEVDTATPT